MNDATAPLRDEDLAPGTLAEAWSMPASWYIDTNLARWERSDVLPGCWQLAALASRLVRPGEHVVATAAGRPVIVLRDGDGGLRAFHNVCRHRAGPLAVADGCADYLQCRYHGWSYHLDGRLRHAGGMAGATDFDPAEHGLLPLSLHEWRDLVFVAPARPRIEAAALDADLQTQLGAWSGAGLRFERRVEYDVGCNWKVYVDNYLEGFHLPFVHPGLARQVVFRDYRTRTARWTSLQSSPLRGESGFYGSGGEARYCFVFPNTMLNILPGRLQTNVVLPLTADRCRVVFDYYYAETEGDAARRQIADDVGTADQIQREDIDICERVQEGLASGAYDRGRLAPEEELGVHHFHECLRAAFRATLADSEVE